MTPSALVTLGVLAASGAELPEPRPTAGGVRRAQAVGHVGAGLCAGAVGLAGIGTGMMAAGEYGLAIGGAFATSAAALSLPCVGMLHGGGVRARTRLRSAVPPTRPQRLAVGFAASGMASLMISAYAGAWHSEPVAVPFAIVGTGCLAGSTLIGMGQLRRNRRDLQGRTGALLPTVLGRRAALVWVGPF